MHLGDDLLVGGEVRAARAAHIDARALQVLLVEEPHLDEHEQRRRWPVLQAAHYLGHSGRLSPNCGSPDVCARSPPKQG